MDIRGAMIFSVDHKCVNLATGEKFYFCDNCVMMYELTRSKSGRLIWQPLYNIAVGLNKQEAEEYIKKEGLILLKRAKQPKSFLVYREADLRGN